MDQSDFGRDLVDMAGRFAHSAARRWESAQWEAGYVPTPICTADRDSIAADSLLRFVDAVAAMEPDENGRPAFPPTAADRRRLLWSCIRFALLDFVRDRATQGQGLEDIPEPWQEPETPEAQQERERREFEDVALIAREFTDKETQRTAVAVAYSPNSIDAAAKLGVVKSTVSKRLKKMQRQFETPSQELYRCICEALETVRTNRPCLLAPVGIPVRSDVLFGHRIERRDR